MILFDKFKKLFNRNQAQSPTTSTIKPVEKTQPKRNKTVYFTQHRGEQPFIAKSGRCANQKGAYGAC